MKFNTNKIILGTAQLINNYGVTNDTFPKRNSSLRFLEAAFTSGVRSFDTAPSYNSEKILGEFIKTNNLSKKINILTKISSLNNKFCKNHINRSIESSLQKLNTSIHTLFFHDPGDFIVFEKNIDFFLDLKEKFPIKNIGFSVYDPKDISFSNKYKLSLSFQFPYNIIDQRFSRIEFINYDKLFCRSVFLQGILLNEVKKLNMPKKIILFQNRYFNLLKKLNLEPLDLILSFLNNSKNFNHFIFGIDNIAQLKKLLNFDFSDKLDLNLVKKINSFFCKKYKDPRTWS